jgi:chorismate synthase
MNKLRYITAGESHGKALIGILEGIPSGLSLSVEDINGDLLRRQGGYGRGGRMKIESDHADILSGVRWGKTIGSPISLLIENKDWENWHDGMSTLKKNEGSIKPVTRARPGHADLPGAIKYNHHDIRNILERSSARETAMRVGLGAVAKKFLSEFNISIGSFVIQIGTQGIAKSNGRMPSVSSYTAHNEELLKVFARAEKSTVRCPDVNASRRMKELIDKAIEQGNSLGGMFEVFITNIPIGLGSHIQWDRRLDGRLAHAIMSIQAIKGVEIGLGFEMSRRSGSEVMDEIVYTAERKEQSAKSAYSELRTGRFYRKTNFAGGIEGGMTNGMPIILRAAMKPIPTQRKPLRSVDITTKKSVLAAYERSDICAVPAAGVIGEAMIALTIADAFLGKFGGDSLKEVKRNYRSYLRYLHSF